MEDESVSDREGNATDGRGVDGALTYPAPPDVLERGGLLNLAKFFGPGAIIASVTIGSGVFLTAWGIRGAIDFVGSL